MNDVLRHRKSSIAAYFAFRGRSKSSIPRTKIQLLFGQKKPPSSLKVRRSHQHSCSQSNYFRKVVLCQAFFRAKQARLAYLALKRSIIRYEYNYMKVCRIFIGFMMRIFDLASHINTLANIEFNALYEVRS